MKKSGPRVQQLSVHLGGLFALVFLFSQTLDSEQEVSASHRYFPLDLCGYNKKL